MRQALVVAFYSLVAAHMAILVANCAAILLLPFVSPWYVAVPVISLLVNLMFSAVECPLTKLENRLRRRLDMPPIKYFVGHYIIWPLRKWRRKVGKAVEAA